MPLAFHLDQQAKFRQQYETARQYILPFIASEIDLEGRRVLEIGCGEGGVLMPFVERGCTCVGVDLSEGKIAFAREALRDERADGRITFVLSDVYDAGFGERYRHAFDLVILKDTIEHIYGHARLLEMIRHLLADAGLLFIAFPPWFMPYGGHQQMADTKLGKLPYYHLLPRRLYRGLLSLFGESEVRIKGLMEVVDTRLTIARMEKLLRACGYAQRKRTFYLINPIYKYKFGLKPVEQLPGIRSLPWVRDFVTTTCYYLVQPAARATE